MCYADKLIVMPEHATLAPPICRLAGEVLSIGRRITQKGVLFILIYLLNYILVHTYFIPTEPAPNYQTRSLAGLVPCLQLRPAGLMSGSARMAVINAEGQTAGPDAVWRDD